jgi:hypothetical protein
MPSTHLRPLSLWASLALAWPLAAWASEGAAVCAARSSARVPLLVELYTSEGCSSCPPADRWLSALKDRPDVLALAFHVDYWDRLGWKDRFSSAAHTQRQSQLLRTSGARYAYTPQVLVDGRDQPRWPRLSLPSPAQQPPASVQATLVREGNGYRAELRPLPDAPPRIAGFWALSEDGHTSAVKSGENRGATLVHDFVVREYLPIAAWDASDAAPRQLQFSPARPADAAHPRHVNLVLVDADSGRPLQALRLGC